MDITADTFIWEQQSYWRSVKWQNWKKKQPKQDGTLVKKSQRDDIFLKIRIALSFIKYMYKFAVDELIGDINITHEEPGKLFRTRLL